MNEGAQEKKTKKPKKEKRNHAAKLCASKELGHGVPR
jgi:hypothetical protein